MTSLSNKVVAITGAGSGIGRALALQAAAEGAALALSDIDEAGLAETAKRCGANAQVRTDRIDVSDRDAVEAWAASVVDEFGRVNIIVNNAGVSLSSNIRDMSYEDFEWLMGINFWGVVHGTKAFLPAVIGSGDGHVVNISSLFGLLAVPSQSAYNAAKFGVRGFTEALRMEMLVDKLPVHVTCVHPGGIKTNIARNGRGDEFHDAEEVADFFDEELAITSPEDAAAAIWTAVRRNRPRVLVGTDAKILDKLVRLVGSGYQRVAARVSQRRVTDTRSPNYLGTRSTPETAQKVSS